MKKSRFTESQIMAILKEGEAGELTLSSRWTPATSRKVLVAH